MAGGDYRTVAWYRDGGSRSDCSKLHLAREGEDRTLCGVDLGPRAPITSVSEKGACGSCARIREQEEPEDGTDWACRACGHQGSERSFKESADRRNLFYCPNCGSPNTGPAGAEADGLDLQEATASQLREKLEQNLDRTRRYPGGSSQAHAAKRVLQFADELRRRAARRSQPTLDDVPEGAEVHADGVSASYELVRPGDVVLIEAEALPDLISEHSAADGRPLSFNGAEHEDGRGLWVVQLEDG